MRDLFVAAALVLLAGCERPLRLPVATLGYDYGRIAAIAGLVADDDNTPTPAPEPKPDDKPKPGDPCPTCDGDGKVGDGTIEATCLDCEGTGRVLAQPRAPKTPVGGAFVEQPRSRYAQAYAAHKADGRPLVVVITASWCDPCHKLQATLRAMDTDGLHVVAIDYQTPEAKRQMQGAMVPQTLVYATSPAGKSLRWRLVGNVPAATLRETFDAAERHTTVSTSAKLPDSLAYPRWTYPGEIRQHLRQSHGVDASGMTTAEAERLHSQLHNAERQGIATASCPTGNCPTGGRVVSRRRLFRR